MVRAFCMPMHFRFSLCLVLSLTLSSLHAADPKPAAKPSPNGPSWKALKPQTPNGFTLKILEVAQYPEHTVELYVYVPDAAGTWPW